MIAEEITEILGLLQWGDATMLLIEQNYQLSICLDDNDWACVLEEDKTSGMVHQRTGKL